MGTRMRDWWRGYTDADVASVQAKMTTAEVNSVVEVSLAEMRASRHEAFRRLGLDVVVA